MSGERKVRKNQKGLSSRNLWPGLFRGSGRAVLVALSCSKDVTCPSLSQAMDWVADFPCHHVSPELQSHCSHYCCKHTHRKRDISVVPISWCPLLLTQSLKQVHKRISSFSASGGRAHMGAHILYTQTFKSCEPKLQSTK